MAKNVRKINKSVLIMAERETSYSVDQLLRGLGLSTTWGARVRGGTGSSLPDCVPVPKSPPSSSRNQLTEARRASSGPGQTPRHGGRPRTGRAGPRQKVLAAPPAPGRTKAEPGTDPDTHTPLSVWHTGDAWGLHSGGGWHPGPSPPWP